MRFEQRIGSVYRAGTKYLLTEKRRALNYLSVAHTTTAFCLTHYSEKRSRKKCAMPSS